MARDLNGTAGSSRNPKTRLDSTVHPRMDFLRFDRSIPSEPKNRRHSFSDGVFDGQTFACSGVDNDTIMFYTLPHRGPTRHDDQVRVLEPARHAVQVVE